MTQQNAIVDKLLTNVSNKLMPVGFIADQVLPSIKVKQTSGLIGKYGNEALRVTNTVHAGEGEYPRVDTVTRSSDTYNIVDHGLQGVITKRDFDNVEKPYDARIDETDNLTTRLTLGAEVALATALLDPLIITQGTILLGNAQYNNRSHADSNPVEDFQTAQNTIIDAIGMPANVAIMDRKVYNALRMHEDLLDSLGFKFNRNGGLTGQELAMALELDQILIGDSFYDSSKLGQTSIITRVWGKDIVLAKVGAPALRQKVLGFTFSSTGSSRRQVNRWSMNTPIGSEGLAVSDNYDQLILNAECAYLIQDAIA